MKSRVVVSGPVSWNQLVILDRLPEPVPHMQFALGDVETVGGTSAGKSLHLAELGLAVTCTTVVGDDDDSVRVVDALRAAGVAVEAVVVPGRGERHLNLMTAAGERVSLYLAVPAAPPPEPAAFSASLRGAAAVVMDLSEPSRALLPAARASDVPVWTDLHDYDGTSDFHEPFVRAGDYVFLSDDRMPDPEPFLRDLVAAGATAAVCTLGARGALAVDRGGLHRVEAVPTHVVDTNGAGDAFFAGFLAATLDSASTDDALAAGARQATVALGSMHLHPALESVLTA